MIAVWLYRIAAVLLVVFAALHTYGFLNFVPPTPEGRAVMESMNGVHFALEGKSFSYGEFYKAFGLFVTVYLLFSAVVAWHLSRATALVLAWGLFLVQVASLALACIYFSTPQISFSGILTLCTGWAVFRNVREV
jgi:hypothetical protein